MERHGSVIRVKPETLEEYKVYHANVWLEVLDMIKQCNIRNYSIYLGELEKGKFYLFSYFEYVGDDFEGDMEKIAAVPMSRKWWDLTDPCQIPLDTRAEGEMWMNMEEVFHTD